MSKHRNKGRDIKGGQQLPQVGDAPAGTSMNDIFAGGPTHTQEVRVTATTHSGPLPPAEEVEKLEAILAGAADRMFGMAEAEQKHRHAIETTLLNAQLTDRNRYRDERRLGQHCAFGIGCIAIIFSAATAIAGGYFESVTTATAGGLIGVGGIVALVTAFLVDHNASKEQSKDAKPPEDTQPKLDNN